MDTFHEAESIWAKGAGLFIGDFGQAMGVGGVEFWSSRFRDFALL